MTILIIEQNKNSLCVEEKDYAEYLQVIHLQDKFSGGRSVSHSDGVGIPSINCANDLKSDISSEHHNQGKNCYNAIVIQQNGRNCWICKHGAKWGEHYPEAVENWQVLSHLLYQLCTNEGRKWASRTLLWHLCPLPTTIMISFWSIYGNFQCVRWLSAKKRQVCGWKLLETCDWKRKQNSEEVKHGHWAGVISIIWTDIRLHGPQKGPTLTTWLHMAQGPRVTLVLLYVRCKCYGLNCVPKKDVMTS